MKKAPRLKLYAVAFVLVAAAAAGALFWWNNQPAKEAAQIEDSSPSEPDGEAVEEDKRVTLVAVGDVMMHIGQVWAGYDEKEKTFDYSGFFAKVRDIITEADIALANLETTLAGPEETFTGYPRFNSPDEIADALKYAGFDIIFTSNNHSMDRGEKGVLRTLRVLRDKGLVPVGTNESEEDRQKLLVSEVNGVNLAFLAYTYGTNGIPLPKDKPFLVNLIDEKVILEDIKAARKSADAVIVYLHFGQEYSRKPSKEQRNLAQKLILAGADLIIGSHPHVLQPGEWLEVETPSGRLNKKYIAYSLGNFISAQTRPHTDEGVILRVTLGMSAEDGSIYVIDVEEIPTWVHKYKERGKMRYVVELGEKPQG